MPHTENLLGKFKSYFLEILQELVVLSLRSKKGQTSNSSLFASEKQEWMSEKHPRLSLCQKLFFLVAPTLRVEEHAKRNQPALQQSLSPNPRLDRSPLPYGVVPRRAGFHHVRYFIFRTRIVPAPLAWLLGRGLIRNPFLLAASADRTVGRHF